MSSDLVSDKVQLLSNTLQERSKDIPTATSQASVDAPIPLSFPAILRNPRLGDRFAYLHDGAQKVQQPSARRARVEKEGKRWVRRRDNARFTSNPHIVQPTSGDYHVDAPQARSTFPEPLPTYLPRVSPVPSHQPPVHDPASAAAGKFSVSLKGVRKSLRRCGGRSQELVKVIDDELTGWLRRESSVLSMQDSGLEERRIIDDLGNITEVRRSYAEIVWSVPDDPFLRWIVHCTARYHSVVSFSKVDQSGTRLTHLLRPNVSRPDFHAVSLLNTPPTTDFDSASSIAFDSTTDGSDFASEHDGASDLSHLSEVDEESQDANANSGVNVARAMESLGLEEQDDHQLDSDHQESDDGFAIIPRVNESRRITRHNTSERVSLLRSASSPSRSPVRRLHAATRRGEARRSHSPVALRSFYSYVFS